MARFPNHQEPPPYVGGGQNDGDEELSVATGEVEVVGPAPARRGNAQNIARHFNSPQQPAYVTPRADPLDQLASVDDELEQDEDDEATRVFDGSNDRAQSHPPPAQVMQVVRPPSRPPQPKYASTIATSRAAFSQDEAYAPRERMHSEAPREYDARVPRAAESNPSAFSSAEMPTGAMAMKPPGRSRSRRIPTTWLLAGGLVLTALLFAAGTAAVVILRRDPAPEPAAVVATPPPTAEAPVPTPVSTRVETTHGPRIPLSDVLNGPYAVDMRIGQNDPPADTTSADAAVIDLPADPNAGKDPNADSKSDNSKSASIDPPPVHHHHDNGDGSRHGTKSGDDLDMDSAARALAKAQLERSLK